MELAMVLLSKFTTGWLALRTKAILLGIAQIAFSEEQPAAFALESHYNCVL